MLRVGLLFGTILVVPAIALAHGGFTSRELITLGIGGITVFGLALGAVGGLGWLIWRAVQHWLMVALVVLVPALAHAADGPSAGGIILQALPWAITGVVALVAFVGWWKPIRAKLNEWGDWAAQKTGFEYLSMLDELLVGLVIEEYELTIRWLKAAVADGKITKAEFQERVTEAWARIKEKAKLLASGGMVAAVPGDLDTYVTSRIGPAIQTAKARGKSPVATGAPLADPSVA